MDQVDVEKKRRFKLITPNRESRNIEEDLEESLLEFSEEDYSYIIDNKPPKIKEHHDLDCHLEKKSRLMRLIDYYIQEIELTL